MKKIVTILSLLTISYTANAGTGSLGCEVRTAKGANAVVSKNVNVVDLTSVSSSNSSSKKIEIGSANGSTVEISLSGYYAGKAILALTVTSADGSKQESLGTAENVLGFTSEKAGQYLSILCRESIEE